MATMSGELEWTEKSENEHHAYRDKAHYIVYKRSVAKWNVAVLSMYTDEPGGFEEKLGDYVVTTLADGKQLAQALADQRTWTW